MATTTIAFTVPVSLIKAFEYVSNVERLPDWSDNIFLFRKLETKSYKVKLKFWIFRIESQYEIIESKYPSRFVTTLKNRFLDFRETFSFYPDPKGSDTDTKILFTSQLELSGSARILNPWIRSKVGEKIRKDIRKLQETLSHGKALGTRNFQVISG
ncbi:polyketide cyclase [Leptospira wolffii]|uniref:LIC13081 family protein n=1 Tax=Leptospira wolffii TaxID=409998 RepID=UPI000347EF3C|nr:polyketide cyclase [Leptospira wolffii]TGK62555.1 polyketide cyclase [Leptospira wolffii]TGK70377.1 polyketide cyclase [Leptospira wolffii]TGK74060.1 polyketide cyclase [Leptospira wolffii]TGL28919.1 polyketide cyclase [Leptospira wolffii]